MMVKVCGITRREDALVAAEAGASAIGFIFYPKSPRYVTPAKAAELSEGLDLLKVGVFVDESPEHIEEVMRQAKLDVAQIYGQLPAQFKVRVWQAIRVAESGTFPCNPDRGEALFLDSAANGVPFDWEFAKFMKEQNQAIFGLEQKVIIAGGLNASNVAEAIRIAQPWGVDASSGLEISPGIKDHEKVRKFVNAAQEI